MKKKKKNKKIKKKSCWKDMTIIIFVASILVWNSRQKSISGFVALCYK